MVHFITGPVGSGKSAKLLEAYNVSKLTGDGFYNIRRFQACKTIGQDLVRISTGESVPFTRVDGSIPVNWDEHERYLSYSFSERGICFANHIINDIIGNNQEAFIDELGPLELQNKGLYFAFKKLLQANLDLYVVCRDSCINAVIYKFQINKFSVYDNTGRLIYESIF